MHQKNLFECTGCGQQTYIPFGNCYFCGSPSSYKPADVVRDPGPPAEIRRKSHEQLSLFIEDWKKTALIAVSPRTINKP